MSLTQFLLLFLFVVVGRLTVLPIRKTYVNSYLYVLFFFVIVVVAVNRPEHMPDYQSYNLAFMGYEGERFEPGFYIIKFVVNAITKIAGNKVVLGFALFALLSIGLKFKYIYSNSVYIWGAILVLMSRILIIQDMIAIRAAVAASLFLYAVKCRMEKNYKLMSLLIIGSIMFHYSALIYLIIYFVNPLKDRRNIYIALLILTHFLHIVGIHFNQYVSLFMFTDSMEQLYDMYKNSDSMTMNVFNLIQLGNVLICILFWLNKQKIKKIDTMGVMYLKLYTIGLCIIPLFSEKIVVAIRLSDLFTVVEIMLFPIGFHALFKDKVKGDFLLISYAIVLFYLDITSSHYWGTI